MRGYSPAKRIARSGYPIFRGGAEFGVEDFGILRFAGIGFAGDAFGMDVFEEFGHGRQSDDAAGRGAAADAMGVALGEVETAFGVDGDGGNHTGIRNGGPRSGLGR